MTFSTEEAVRRLRDGYELSSSLRKELVQAFDDLCEWADRMPDAGITTDDPRLQWWYDRPTPRAQSGRPQGGDDG